MFRVLIILAMAVAVVPARAADRVPLPDVTTGKGEQCVEPTPDMRRNHMRYLTHQRDETVHRGIRTKRHSLKECVACHAGEDEQGRVLPVNSPGQFCASCHRFAAVSLDCFQCHATTPDDGEQPSTGPAGTAASDLPDARGMGRLMAAGSSARGERP